MRHQPVGEAPPAWTPNGTRVAFISLVNAIELKAAAGTGDVTRLVESTHPVPQAFSPGRADLDRLRRWRHLPAATGRRADIDELYHRNGDHMIRVAFDITSAFSYGPPEVLFEGPYDTHRARNYDVARDGRFLMVKDVTPGDRTSARQHLMIVQNWDEELERIFADVE